MFGGHIQTPGIVTNGVISFSGLGDNVVVAGAAGKKIYIFRLYFILAADSNLTFKNGQIVLSGVMPFKANQGMVLDPTECPWHQCAAGSDFIINSSIAVQVSGSIGYIQS